MNLIWMLLNVHRGSLDQEGSLTHLFAVLEKVRLGAEHPDFHTLLAALTQILDGLLLNAWRSETGYKDLTSYAQMLPKAADIFRQARIIVHKYATPTEEPYPKEDKDRSSTPDHIHENTIRLTRDLLLVTELVDAIATGDFGRVEDALPDLACLFRGGGSNNYSTEILHFLHNIKEVWTPEFA
ncbi:hypothetical protein H0H92_000223, partial [Tricholoma furcatifolium]